MLKSACLPSGKDIVRSPRYCEYSTYVSPGVWAILLSMLIARSEVNMRPPYVFILCFYLSILRRVN